MNGALLHATGQYVACFVFLFDNNIQKVDTFHSHNLTSVGTARTLKYGRNIHVHWPFIVFWGNAWKHKHARNKTSSKTNNGTKPVYNITM